MMSRTAEFHSVMGERAMRRASRVAVGLAATVATLLVASAVRSAAATYAAPPVLWAAPAGADAITSFGPIESHLGLVRGEVVSHPALVSGTDQSWTVRLSSPTGKSIDNAWVAAEAYMPESTDRMHAAPEVRYIGDGGYTIDGLRFSRAGWWNVSLTIRSATGADSLAFNLIVAR